MYICIVPDNLALCQTLPHADTAQIYLLQDKVAAALFGEDAFIDNTTMLKPAVVTFAKTLLTTSWNRYRKTVRRDVRQMDTAFQEVTQLWNGASSRIALRLCITESITRSVQR